MKTRIIQDEPFERAEGPTGGDGPPVGGRPVKGVAARVGRWSANHWKTAVFGWLAFVVASMLIGNVVAPKYLETSETNVGESRRADKLIDSGFPSKADEQSEVVLIQSRTATLSDPPFRAVVEDATRTLASFPQVEKLHSPLAAAHADLVSEDEHSVMITFTPKGDYETVVTYIDTIETAVDEVGARHPGFDVDNLGVSTEKKADEAIKGMLLTAGMIAIPLTLVILLVVFGSAVAAIAPLLLALTAVLATNGLVSLPSQVFPVDAQIGEVILLIGLAVGIDYSLFYLRREREERAAGRSEGAALEAAAATSGRAVLISGVTVLIAMAGMFLSGDKTFMSFSIGTMMVVAVAMIGSLTVLPALLAKLGDRVEKGRVPFVRRLRSKNGEGLLWGAIVDRVLRRPVVSAVAATAVLVALAVPAFALNPTATGADDIQIAAIEPVKKLQQAFPGTSPP
jgi:RND superfamily putative drug exporter